MRKIIFKINDKFKNNLIFKFIKKIIKIFIKRIRIKNERQISFLNIPVFQYGRRNFEKREEKYIEIFPIPNLKKTIQHYILNLIVNNVPNKFKNIIFIRSGLGETYLLNLYMKQYMKIYNISYEDTCFVGVRQCFSDLFKQYNPQVSYFKLNIDFSQFNYVIENDFYKFKNKNIYIYISKKLIFSYMDKMKNSLSNEQIPHFIDYVSSNFGFKGDKQVYTEYLDKEILKNKILKDNIKIDNLIFISEKSISMKPLSLNFWNKLKQIIKQKGYSLFENNLNYTITEAKEIAKMSKKIIALRSGFIETLTDINKPMYVIYTEVLFFNAISPSKTLKAYSLKKYPGIKKDIIKEFNIDIYSEDKIIEAILEDL